ncbi:hypothetical protein EIP86_008686 [Pleurotus ostreatoroseus]|nr:hypothetical protein EIP86_008686 [Pleurotus ostreatoroseus]
MGNSTSNANTQADPKSSASPRYTSPSRRANSQSPAPNANGSTANGSAPRVHRSLRHKKKSLELPDLASLALTPALGSPGGAAGGYRRPRASSPIPIPTSPHPPPPTFRVQNNLPSAAHIAGAGRRYSAKDKDRSYLSSGFPSARSFTRAGEGEGDEGDERDGSRDREGEEGSPGRLAEERREFVPEVVHSTIPLVLVKADGERPEHVAVTIKWRGGGKSVILARAGDDYWKGRQPMDYE